MPTVKDKKDELKEALEGVENSDFFKQILGHIDDAPAGDGNGKGDDAPPDEDAPAGDAPEDAMPPIPKRKVPPKKEPPKKDDEDDDDDAPPKKDKDEDEDEDAVPARLEPDYEKIAEAAGRGVAKVLGEKPAAGGRKRVDAFDDLPAEYAAKKELYRHLVALKPGKYTADGIAGDVKRFKEAEAKYRKEWETEHEGETYNPSAEEHTTFYDRNEPSVDTDDLEAAKASVIRSQVKSDLDKEYSEKFRKVEQREKTGEVLQQAEGVWATMLGDVVTELTGLEKPDTSPQALNKLADEDPLVAGAMMAVLPGYRKRVHLAYGILNGVIDYDDTNREHVEIANKVGEIERELDSKPPAETVFRRNGKVVRYINTEGYGRLTPAQKADYWTLDPQYVGRYLASEAKEKTIAAKKAAETEFERTAKARGYAMPPSRNGNGRSTRVTSESADGEERAPLLRGRKERGGPPRGDKKDEDRTSEGIERFFSNLGAI